MKEKHVGEEMKFMETVRVMVKDNEKENKNEKKQMKLRQYAQAS